MTEEELQIYIKVHINFMEDYLLKKGLLGIVDKGKIEIRLGHSCDEEVEVYTTLNLIKASFQFRNKRGFKDLWQQYTELNIKHLIIKFDMLISRL